MALGVPWAPGLRRGGYELELRHREQGGRRSATGHRSEHAGDTKDPHTDPYVPDVVELVLPPGYTPLLVCLSFSVAGYVVCGLPILDRMGVAKIAKDLRVSEKIAKRIVRNRYGRLCRSIRVKASVAGVGHVLLAAPLGAAFSMLAAILISWTTAGIKSTWREFVGFVILGVGYVGLRKGVSYVASWGRGPNDILQIYNELEEPVNPIGNRKRGHKSGGP